jgi:hypothetical protein
MDGHSAMAAMQHGRRSGRFPQNDTHGIELVERLAIGVLAERIPSMRRNWKTISEAGTIFQG